MFGGEFLQSVQMRILSTVAKRKRKRKKRQLQSMVPNKLVPIGLDENLIHSSKKKKEKKKKKQKRQLQSMVTNKLVDNSHVDERIKDCWSSSSRLSQNSLALTVRCSPNNIYGWVQGILGSKFTSQVGEWEAYRILPSL